MLTENISRCYRICSFTRKHIRRTINVPGCCFYSENSSKIRYLLYIKLISDVRLSLFPKIEIFGHAVLIRRAHARYLRYRMEYVYRKNVRISVATILLSENGVVSR